jgi:RNA polymerase sigma-70 factor (ECF subfamily)
MGAEPAAARALIGTNADRGEGELAARREERRLLREAQNGSEEALEALVRRTWPLAHRAAYLVLRDEAAAEDVAQEALVAAIRSLDRFDRRRPFGPWLHRIAVNRAIDHARARTARPEAASGRAEEAERLAVSATYDSAPDPRADHLDEALAQLTPEHRAIVAMRYLLDLTPGEIAEELGLPRGTVNSRLRRALDQLAAHMEGAP